MPTEGRRALARIELSWENLANRSPHNQKMFRLWLVAACVGSLALGLTVSGCGGSPTSPSEVDSTFFSFVSRPGDYVGQGRTQTFTPLTGSFTAVQLCSGNHLHVIYTGRDNSRWSLDFAAPGGRSLAPGAYENATRWPFQLSVSPGLSVSGEGRGCNREAGRFDVTAAEFGSFGAVTRFRARFENHCEDTGPGLTGEISLLNVPTHQMPWQC
jgi:hypothetical protein